MGFKVKKHDTFQPGKNTARVVNKDYKGFVAQLPCLVSKRFGVQVAHLSSKRLAAAHFGSAGYRKIDDCFTLPLHKDMHDEQHSMNEMGFWLSHCIDPHLAALSLYAQWTLHGEDCLHDMTRLIMEGHIGNIQPQELVF